MRNPYFILGIPFGVSVAEARKAFNTAMRRVTREVDPQFSVDDLNWAIYAIEKNANNGLEPDLDIENFRVPLNPENFAVLDAIKGAKLADMVLPQPNPQPIARVTTARVTMGKGNAKNPEYDQPSTRPHSDLVIGELFNSIAAKYQNKPLPALVAFQGD